jgi:hypothetical protein
MGQWDDMIARRQSDADEFREFIREAEAGLWVLKRREGGGERDVLTDEIERAKMKLAEAEAQVARLREKNFDA